MRSQTLNAAIATNAAQREGAYGAMVGAREREAQARGQPARLRAELSEARAANLEDRASLAAGQASTLGMIGPAGRAMGLQAFRMLQESGNPDLLPPQLLQAALSFGGPAAHKIVESYGAKTPEFRAGMGITPEVFGSPEELRRQAQEARNQAERDRLAAEAGIAITAAGAGKDFGEFLSRTMADLLSAAKSEILNRVKLGKNQ